MDLDIDLEGQQAALQPPGASFSLFHITFIFG